ncbi:hypothetical protein UlMin_018307 [Ulmus minor]
MASNGDGVWAGSRRLQNLARHFCLVQKQPPSPGFTNQAAVLICLFQGDDGHLRVILTKRAPSLSSYSGEVALPGGKVEEGDADYVDTALREAKEEIGLDPSQVNVVTVLHPFVAKRNVLVVPVIGLLSEKKKFNPVPNDGEVEAIFDEAKYKGEEFLCNFFDFETDNKKYVIWALTAEILIRAASIVYQRPPAFVERSPKFWSLGAVEDATTTQIQSTPQFS